MQLMLAEIVLPAGTWATDALAWIEPLVVTGVTAAAAYAMRQLPGWAVAFVQDYVTQQRIGRAVHWGVTQIDHELIDPVTGLTRTVSIETGNALVDMAQQYILAFAPEMAEELGAKLKPRILAEIAKIGMAPAAALPNPLPAKPVKQNTK